MYCIFEILIEIKNLFLWKLEKHTRDRFSFINWYLTYIVPVTNPGR